jgi:hypothetical protein
MLEPDAAASITIAMLQPVSVKDEPKHLGEMDGFASLAMTAVALSYFGSTIT